MELKKVEEGVIPIYENETRERLINARELHRTLKIGKDFTTWMRDRINKYGFIENSDFILTFPKIGERKNVVKHEYYLTIDTSKEICMIENNEIGRNIRRYFIKVEKRYRNIINAGNSTNQLINIMQNAIDYMRENNIRVDNLEIGLTEVREEVKELKSKIDIKIKNNYCLASDIAEQLNIYSENKIPHSNFIGAIARELGYKISYKHFYEDEYIAIVKDVTKNEYWQVYFKPIAVNEIIKWFNDNKEEIYYEIQYVRNTKSGKKGELKEKGYKIENICYKVSDID